MFDPHELTAVFSLHKAKVRGDNLMSRCPLGLHDDWHPSFGINLYSGRWNCFACGEKGANLRTLAYKLRLLLPDSLMRQTFLTFSLPNKEVERITYPKSNLPVVGKPDLYEELYDRSINFRTIKKYKVGYKGKGTFVFPCILPDGKLYGWVERNSRWSGRYGFSPKNVNRKLLLFGLDKPIKEIYLVESMTDMLKLATFGADAVSTCGNMFFPEQAQWITQYCDSVVLVPQRDLSAKKWLADIKKYLKGKMPIRGIAIKKCFKDVGGMDYLYSNWTEDKLTEKFLY